MKFSERYGYLKPSEIIIQEKITPEIQNAICTCYDNLKEQLYSMSRMSDYYVRLEEYIWTYFLNKRKSEFHLDYDSYRIVCTSIISDNKVEWYTKLDLIEETISVLRDYAPNFNIEAFFIHALNSEFERLNFGYRIVDDEITPITDNQQIESIETALENNKQNIRLHLNNALKLYSQRPLADYRNSIKESITAVEAFTRDITGDKGLNLAKMESEGIQIPPVLRKSFEIIYGYTNDPSTGIRHALMNETSEYIPKAEEALFMLVSCSAFINYLNSKMG